MPAEARAISHVERILYLRKIPIVGTLPPRDLALVAEYARERSFPRGTVIFREGEPVPAIQYLVDGTVHVSRKGVLMGHAGAGSAVGGIGVLARDGDGIQAVAEADTMTLELPADAVFELFEDQFPILHHVLREVCRQLIALVLRVPSTLEVAPSLRVRGPVRPSAGDLDLVDRILLLRQVPSLSRASVNALAELSRGMAEVRFEPGVTVWQEGDPSGWVLIVLDGALSCACSTGYRFRLGPGTPPGALESTAETPRWFTAVTESPLVALHGQFEALLDVFEDNYEMAADYLAFMSRWLLEGMERAAAPDETELQHLYGCEEEEAAAGGASSLEAGRP